MKIVARKTSRPALLAAAFACLAVAASAQQPAAQARVRVQLEALDRLAARAEKSVDVSVDQNTLKLAGVFFKNPKGEDARAAAEAIRGLQGVYVRVYEFAADGQWSESDIADIRRQVKEEGWSNIVNVRKRSEGRHVEVHLRAGEGKIGGLVVLSTEPRQLVVVNMVGDVDLEKLVSLQGRFSIPELDLRGDEDDDRKPEAKPAGRKP